MKVSIQNVERRIADVLRALDRREPVTITYRGRRKGVLIPVDAQRTPAGSAANHPAFGLWRDRAESKDVDAFVRRLRKRHVDIDGRGPLGPSAVTERT